MSEPNSHLPHLRAAMLARHTEWVAACGGNHVHHWESTRANDEEAALCEAAFRTCLEHRGVIVRPYDSGDATSPRPDFKCSIGSFCFFVEVTCIQARAGQEKLGLKKAGKTWRSTSYRGLQHSVLRKACDKTRQCGSVDAPVLVAIGAVDPYVAAVGINEDLRADAVCQMVQDAQPTVIGYDPTDDCTYAELRSTPDHTSSVFMDNDGQTYRRTEIAGVILAGFCRLDEDGVRATELRGILHPRPHWPFDKALLPDVFGA